MDEEALKRARESRRGGRGETEGSRKLAELTASGSDAYRMTREAAGRAIGRSRDIASKHALGSTTPTIFDAAAYSRLTRDWIRAEDWLTAEERDALSSVAPIGSETDLSPEFRFLLSDLETRMGELKRLERESQGRRRLELASAIDALATVIRRVRQASEN